MLAFVDKNGRWDSGKTPTNQFLIVTGVCVCVCVLLLCFFFKVEWLLPRRQRGRFQAKFTDEQASRRHTKGWWRDLVNFTSFN